MFEPFQKFVIKAAGRYGINTEMKAAAVCHHFRESIPKIFDHEEAKNYIAPAFYKESVLVINTKTPAWSQEVIMRKEKIIAEVNSRLGEKIIKNLRTQLRNF